MIPTVVARWCNSRAPASSLSLSLSLSLAHIKIPNPEGLGDIRPSLVRISVVARTPSPAMAANTSLYFAASGDDEESTSSAACSSNLAAVALCCPAAVGASASTEIFGGLKEATAGLICRRRRGLIFPLFSCRFAAGCCNTFF